MEFSIKFNGLERPWNFSKSVTAEGLLATPSKPPVYWPVVRARFLTKQNIYITWVTSVIQVIYLSSVQVNIRTTRFLATELDRIVKEGYFRSRSEAMNEAIRILIRKYQVAKLESKLAKVKKGTKNLPSVTKALLEARQEEDAWENVWTLQLL